MIIYPRTTKWEESYVTSELPAEIVSLIREKITKNAFGGEGLYIIGNDISRFNHSKNPNAYVTTTMLNCDIDFKLPVLSVIAGNEINTGDEILIKYNNVVSYDKKESTEEPHPLKILETSVVDDMVKHYLKSYVGTNTFFEIILKQLCSYYGLYMIYDILSISPRFIKHLKDQPYYDASDIKGCARRWIRINQKKLLDSLAEKLHDSSAEKFNCAVLIASHVCYDEQLGYLQKCFDSLLTQTCRSDIFCSISFDNETYKQQFNQIIIPKYSTNIKFVIHEIKKSQFQHLFSLVEHVKTHDLLLFCDDDDTYSPQRIQIFNNHYTLASSQQLGKNKIFGGIHYGTNREVVGEFWQWGVAPLLLKNFFDKLSGHDEILSHKFCDVVFSSHIKRLNTNYMFAYIEPSCEIGGSYQYNIHNNSVTGKIQNLTQVNVSVIRDHSFHMACQLYTIKNFKKQLFRGVQMDHYKMVQIFPQYIDYFKGLRQLFSDIYDIKSSPK